MKWMHLPSILLCIAALGVVAGCGERRYRPTAEEGGEYSPAPWDLVEEGESPPDNSSLAASQTATDTLNREDAESEDASTFDLAMAQLADSVETLPVNLGRYRGFGRLNEVFNDSNKYQYAAGERIGIKPIRTLAAAYFSGRPLVKLESNSLYTVEELTHSMPYLVPQAARLLETIGRNFQDSLRSRNLQGHKFRVTSLLRTAQSVKKLKKVNRNATDSSTHQLATTFDISYAKFDHDGKSPKASDEELKYVLAEVLRDLRRQQKCLVKYEIKSPCFHITATEKN